ncbi:MAG: leucine-rich repeat domain-containing protein [Oscillospiraceae bacterium]|nr:leucine-rich repeat domain-containing protein [Oscillospiraceae bacterium]
MKKLFIVTIITGLLLILCSCTKNSDTDETVIATSTKSETVISETTTVFSETMTVIETFISTDEISSLPEYLVYGDFLYEFDEENDGIVIVEYIGVETEVIIPEVIDGLPVIRIGWGAFKNNTELLAVIIPNSVVRIGGGVFEGCVMLNSVIIPESVTVIGGSAFFNCSSLTTITIPESVVTIGDWAFSGCVSLKSINIPDEIIRFGGDVFENCSSLTSVMYKGVEYSIEETEWGKWILPEEFYDAVNGQ